MARIDFDFDPTRVTIILSDPRLKRIIIRDPERCATLNEYASACGMDTAEVVEALGPYLDTAELALDFYGDEVFLHTAPNGRGPESGALNIPPNLWERLRERCSVDEAYALWKLLRSLQRSGWTVEHRLHRIMFGIGPVRDVPYLGVVTGHATIPTLIFPPADSLISSDGLLEQYEQAGATALAVICDERALDEMVTAVRRWVLSRPVPIGMSVLVLEAPRYNPTLLSPGDAAVVPVAVTRDTLGNYFW